MNGLFIMSFAFVIMIMMSLTSIVSRQANKIKLLVQELAMMEKRIRELESRQFSDSNDEFNDTEKKV